MKTLFLKSVSSLLLLAAIGFSACNKKDDDKVDPTDDTLVWNQQANDEQQAYTQADMSMDDAESILASSSLSGFKTTSLPCNATIDSSQIATGLITITYSGPSCDGLRSRTGSISILIQNYPTVKWKDVGAVAVISFNNFRVTRLSTNKSITLNGAHQVTNVSGGLLRNIGQGGTPGTLVRKIRSSNMVLTFDSGVQRTWSVARRRTWTGASGIPTGLSLSGDTTINGNANTAVWGINRSGNPFITTIGTPVVVNSGCGWYAPVSGYKTHYIGSRNFSVTFGTDSNGNPGGSACPGYYKINWTTVSGQARSYVAQY